MVGGRIACLCHLRFAMLFVATWVAFGGLLLDSCIAGLRHIHERETRSTTSFGRRSPVRIPFRMDFKVFIM